MLKGESMKVLRLPATSGSRPVHEGQPEQAVAARTTRYCQKQTQQARTIKTFPEDFKVQ